MVRDDQVSHVVVTGSEGYIGSVLTPILVRMGYRVSGIDAGWFARGSLVPGTSPARLLTMDIRDVEPAHLRGAEAIVHLAGLSSDAVAELDPELTMEINHRATIRLAEMARAVGVRRFVHFSTCSVYDACRQDLADESAPLEPSGVLARSKLLAERDLLALGTDEFRPTTLRLAQVYGISPRQRFDVLVPRLAGRAWVHGAIRFDSDGTERRPLIHLRDVVRATVCCLSAPSSAVGGRCFNLGDARADHRDRDVADEIHRQLPQCEITCGPAVPSRRGCRVRFDTIHRELPGFTIQWDLETGVSECMKTFRAISLDEPTLRSPAYNREEELRRLIEEGVLRSDLRPRRNEAAPA